MVGYLVQEERDNCFASVSGSVVNLEFSGMFFFVNEMFLGEFEYNLVSFVNEFSIIISVSHFSEISGHDGLVSI